MSLNLDQSRWNAEVSNGPVRRTRLRLVGAERDRQSGPRQVHRVRDAGPGVAARLVLWYVVSLCCLGVLIAGAAWLEGYW
jgi:hypothetical protein